MNPISTLFAFLMNLPERPMRWAQGRLSKGRLGWVFVAPNLAVFALFTFLPIAFDIHYALTGGTNLLPSQRPYVGAENFASLLDCTDHFDANTCHRDLFWHGVWNTLRFVVFQVGLMLAFSLLTAIVLNRKIIGRSFFRAAFFYPVLLSPVVVALIWKWILQREGLLNAAMIGVGAEPTNWLLDPHWAFFWSVFVSIWAHMGFYTLILLAGLQAIPAEINEASQMDATPPWRHFRRITLPLLMPNVMVVLVLGLIRAVQVFDAVYGLTGGGPGSATVFVVQYIYKTGFADQIRQYGLAAAASLLLAGVLLVLTLAQMKGSQKKNG